MSSVKNLKLDEIDEYIRLLDNSVKGKDNRISKRSPVDIPIKFAICSINGEFKEDHDQPMKQSKLVDISKDGAGLITGRRYNLGDIIHCIGFGENKKFNAKLEVVNTRRADSIQHRYGCKIMIFEVTK
ncbi:MAG: PilZ domain-containing protein [Planctomycetes bacterium]|nr:PilZ domain-containing protein [Planctomycetota bacterium]